MRLIDHIFNIQFIKDYSNYFHVNKLNVEIVFHIFKARIECLRHGHNYVHCCRTGNSYISVCKNCGKKSVFTLIRYSQNKKF